MKKTIKTAIVTAAITAAGLGMAATASADAISTAVDGSYSATCGVFDRVFTGGVYNDSQVVLGVAEGMLNAYPSLTASDAAQVIDTQVYEYCPRYWGDLVAVGNAARSTPTLTQRQIDAYYN